MPTVIEIINSAYGVYLSSRDGAELARAAESLSAMLADKSVSKIISPENRENAEFLNIKLQLKAHCCAYFCEGYENADFLALKSYADSAVEMCAKQGFKKTGALCASVLACADAAHAIMFDAVALKARICDGEGLCVATDADECRSVSLELSKKTERAEALNIPQNIFTDGAKFPDVKKQIIEDLRELRAVADNMAKALCAAQIKDVMRTGAEDITALLKGRGYEFFPEVDLSKLARAVVLFTPFPEEAEMLAYSYAQGANVYRVQALAFEGVDGGGLAAAFEEFASRSAHLVIYGVPRYRAKNKGDFLRAVMRYCKAGGRAYIVADDGTRAVYDEAIKCASGEVTSLDISFMYLTLPDFVQTVELMQGLKMLYDGGDIDFVRKNMPFVGFTGLDEVVKAFRAGADWKKIAAERSQDNFLAASKYMLRLPRQALFIDGGWGNYHEDIVVNRSKTFDYDDVRIVNPDNIRKIMDGNFTLFQKCGMISTYCLLCGASAADWAGFSPEVKSERLTEASKLVMRALGVNIVPKVEVLENVGSKGAGGTCYDGGKRIVYKNSCVKDFDWTSKAVCHECFHAFQHRAISEGWQDWFETELHLTPGRIDQWSYNFGKYRNIDKDYDGYMIQIVESDARAFENDCLGKNESMGQILNLIDLD